jgi:pilus assembly protein CpaC
MGQGSAAGPPWARHGGGIGLLVVCLAGTAGAQGAPANEGVVDAPRAVSSVRTTSRRSADSIITNYTNQIDVPAGQSAIVRLRRPAQRVAIADPDVADVVLVSPTEILINGKGRRFTSQSGEPVTLEAQTSLIVWDKGGAADVRALYVNRSRAEQVELQVTVAELNRSIMEEQGFDFRLVAGNVLVSSTPAHLFSMAGFTPAATNALGNEAVNVLQATDRVTFNVLDLGNNFQAFIELLQQESLAKILARPSLLSRSGEEAHFRSGGEVPIPLVTNNQVAVQFKEFGTIVNFTPTFTDDGGVDLRVAAELSAPDRTVGGVTVSGFNVPSFISRQANTRVRLRPGQSLLIAGLLRDDETEQEQKVPYLGDVPYLGAFFRRTTFTHLKSELMILVQPRVVTIEEAAGERLPIDRGPLTRSEVLTRPTPNKVSRPRLLDSIPKPSDEITPGPGEMYQ